MRQQERLKGGFYADEIVLCSSQQFFIHAGNISCLPGKNQYTKQRIVFCSRTQHNRSAGGGLEPAILRSLV